MKIRRVGTKLFRSDGRTKRQADMTKLIVTLCSSLNAPNNVAAGRSVLPGRLRFDDPWYTRKVSLLLFSRNNQQDATL